MAEHTLAQPKLKVTPWCTPTHPSQCSSQVSTFYTLRNPRNSPDKILKLMVTTTRSKVKSRSHQDVVHLQPLTNVPTKYKLPTPYSFQNIAQTRFYRSRSNQGHTMTLHTLTPQPKSLLVSTSYTLRLLKYSSDKLFTLPAHLDAMGENNTPTALSSYGVKSTWV